MTAADTIKEIQVEVKRCAECGARFGIEAAFCPFDGVALSTSTWDKAGDPRAHITVDDRYEVLEPLGEGGMGTVYEVRHVTLDRHFAMKVLRRDLATDADLAARFLQEAKATAAVKHPSVVAITDFGEMEDGVPYFVMELLEGETLATRIRARGPLAPHAAIRVAKQIADALAASHAANVIHRDLKPENVFLVGSRAGKAAEEEIRIVDFGAAKIVGGSKLTRPGIVFGTPYYMSPEQASGAPIDARADVYSLGILLYEMITGRVPFEADTYMGVLTKHIFQAPPRPVAPSGVQLGPLEHVVMRALAKEPDARYASMNAFALSLEEAARGRLVEPVREEHAPTRTMKMPGMTTADRIQLSVSRSIAAETRRTQRLVVIGFVAACVTVVLGVVLISATQRPQPSATPTSAAVEPSRAGATATSAAAAVTTAPAPIADSSEDPSPPARSSAEPTSTAVLSAPTTVAPKQVPAPATSSAREAPKPRAGTAAVAAPAPPPVKKLPSSTDDFRDPWKQ